jgi:SHOCT domain
MTPEQFEAEKQYHMAIYLVESLHRQKLINDEKFEKVREDLIDKYQPVISSLMGIL